MGGAGSGRARRSQRGTSPTWVVLRPAGAKAATPQITSTLEALDHRGQVAGSKGVGRIQGYGKKYRHNRLREPRQMPDSGRATTNKRLTARFYQLKLESGFTASLANTLHTSCGRRSSPPLSAGGALTGLRHGNISSSSARTGKASRKSCGWRCGGHRET
jgi:hypothetical protein